MVAEYGNERMRAITSNDEGIPGGKVRSSLCDIIIYDLGAGESVCLIINAGGSR